MASSVIVKNREILGGVHVIAGTRSPFQVLPDYIEAGKTLMPTENSCGWRRTGSRLYHQC
jgi:hypothetical protein